MELVTPVGGLTVDAESVVCADTCCGFDSKKKVAPKRLEKSIVVTTDLTGCNRLGTLS